MVTAPIDGIEVKVSLRLRGIAALMAGVECTSLRVRVEVDNEDPMDGFRELCAVTYLTTVALNIDNRTKPIPTANEGLLGRRKESGKLSTRLQPPVHEPQAYRAASTPRSTDCSSVAWFPKLCSNRAAT